MGTIFKSVTDQDPGLFDQLLLFFSHLSHIYFIVCYGLKLRHSINNVDQLDVRAQNSMLCGKLALSSRKSLEILWHSVKELN